MSWQTLGPPQLTQARIHAHYAAQLLCAVALADVEPLPGDAHQNLGWDDSLEGFVGRQVRNGSRHVALSVPSLTLFVCEKDEASQFALSGRTLSEAFRWLEGELKMNPQTLRLPEHDLPNHALSSDGRFEASDALTELARWYHNAAQAIGALVGSRTDASPLRCWPHHFDLATLVTLKPDPDPESARTVGVGMTPGDGSYPDPYFYVTPWPYPDDRLSVPALATDGHWHRDGWFGAVLTGQDLSRGNSIDQQKRLSAFVSEATRVCIQIASAQT